MLLILSMTMAILEIILVVFPKVKRTTSCEYLCPFLSKSWGEISQGDLSEVIDSDDACEFIVRKHLKHSKRMENCIINPVGNIRRNVLDVKHDCNGSKTQ